jgi:hypothetical protein
MLVGVLCVRQPVLTSQAQAGRGVLSWGQGSGRHQVRDGIN